LITVLRGGKQTRSAHLPNPRSGLWWARPEDPRAAMHLSRKPEYSARLANVGEVKK
jgi:hypothetical protein